MISVLEPKQIVSFSKLMVNEGRAEFTVISIDSDAVHPLESVATTVYVVVVDGVAKTVADVLSFNEAEGDHS